MKAWVDNSVGLQGPIWLPPNTDLGLEPRFLARVGLPWKLANMIEARGKEQRKEKNSRKYCKN